MTMTMTLQEAADALDQGEYREEGTLDLFKRMRDAGLVAAFGASDDLMELRGAVDDEIGAYDGGTAFFTKTGILENDCEDDRCPHFARLKKSASKVEAVWSPKDVDASWIMKTDLPHASFSILEDGEVYCIGLVFSLADCAG